MKKQKKSFSTFGLPFFFLLAFCIGVPSRDALAQSSLSADGGDPTSVKYDGGAGATVSTYIKIGTGTGEIPAGSQLRFIIGKKGESQHECGGGGNNGSTGYTSKSSADPKTVGKGYKSSVDQSGTPAGIPARVRLR